MKTSSSHLMLFAAISSAVLLQAGCSKSDNAAQQAAAGANAGNPGVAANPSASKSDSWDAIKDYAYDQRAEFTASFDRMTAKMDAKASEMKATNANLSDAAAKDRDQAMNELAEARAELKSNLTDLDKATADTWSSAKDNVGRAWQKVNAAFAKTTSSSTPGAVSSQ